MTEQEFSTPEEIAEEGRRIFESRYREEYERDHSGKYVAVDVMDGSIVAGLSAFETLTEAKSRNPEHLFHLMRIGHPAAFDMRGFMSRHATSTRVS